MAKTHTLEKAVGDEVLSILEQHGSTGIPLSKLPILYKKIHGTKIACSKGKLKVCLENLDGLEIKGKKAWFVGAPTYLPGQIINVPKFQCAVCSNIAFSSEEKYKTHLRSQSHVDRVALLVSAGWVSPVDFTSHRHNGAPLQAMPSDHGDVRPEDEMLPEMTFTVIESVDGMSNTQTINSADLSSVTYYACPEEEEPSQISENEIVREESLQGTKSQSFDRRPKTPEKRLQQECRAIEERLLRSSGGEFKEVVVHQDTDSLLDILPAEWGESLEQIGLDGISDISLDIGRRPYCWHCKRRHYLSDDEDYLVEHDDLREIILNLQDFGDDNRAGLDGQLHRISAIRDNQELIIGLTIRVGRHVDGNAALIRDLLADDRSILLLGEPGSGKTTIVRDIAKELSERGNVFIVDTSNEIAGDGGVPHPCVGMSRRMMVPSLRDQASVMVECLQNHTPEVMVIDEIGRGQEVEAAQTSKNRGVRMVASAHGDLRSLMKNRELRGLIGGLATTTLGDMEARRMQKKTKGEILQKQVTQRAGAPIFETIIELRRGRLNEWHIIPDVATAVDSVLKGKTYDVQKRIRCNESHRYLVDYIEG